MRSELADTLIELIDALEAPPESGLVVTEAEVDFPMEIAAATRAGRLVFFGSAPHTRWITGVLPEVHIARLRVALDDVEAQCGR